MLRRLLLQATLENILGSRNVYFQPPASVSMDYPAIVYSLNGIENKHASNGVYVQGISYEVIVVDEDPDNEISKVVSKLPMCKYNRSYRSDNLNHDVYTLFY